MKNSDKFLFKEEYGCKEHNGEINTCKNCLYAINGCKMVNKHKVQIRYIKDVKKL